MAELRRTNSRFSTAEEVEAPTPVIALSHTKSYQVPLQAVQEGEPLSSAMSTLFDDYGLAYDSIKPTYEQLTREGFQPKIPGLYQIWSDDPKKEGTVPTTMPIVVGPPKWEEKDGKVVGTLGCGDEYFSGAPDGINPHLTHVVWSARNIPCESWLDLVADPAKYIPLLEEFYMDICRTMAFHLEFAHPGAFGIAKGNYTPNEIATKIHFCACHAKSSLRRLHFHVVSGDDVSQTRITDAGSGQGDRHIKFQDLIKFLKTCEKQEPELEPESA